MAKFYKIEYLNDSSWESFPPITEDDPLLLIREEDVERWTWACKQNHKNAEVRSVFVKEDKSCHYTPFGNHISVDRNGVGNGSWKCGKRWFSKKCQFDITKDPACDNCIHCSEPEERF